MAFEWLSARQSSYGRGADDETKMVRRAALGGVAILIVGVLIGVGGKTLFSGGKAAAADQVTASPNVSDDFKKAPKTEDGALRVMTSYVTGFTSVALQSADSQRAVLDTIVAPNADSTLRTDLAQILVDGRNRVLGSGTAASAVTMRVLSAPASYKVDKLADDQMRVQIWYNTTIVDASGQQAQSSWFTIDAKVQWSDHWRIATYVVNGGPTPEVRAENREISPYADVIRVFNGFKSYRQAPQLPKS